MTHVRHLAPWLAPSQRSGNICRIDGEMVNRPEPFPLFWESNLSGNLWGNRKFLPRQGTSKAGYIQGLTYAIAELGSMLAVQIIPLLACQVTQILSLQIDSFRLAFRPYVLALLQKTRPCPIRQGVDSKSYCTSEEKNSTLNLEERWHLDRWRGKGKMTQVMWRQKWGTRAPWVAEDSVWSFRGPEGPVGKSSEIKVPPWKIWIHLNWSHRILDPKRNF